MRIIHINEYDEKKMTLAEPVYDNFGRVLLAEGRTVHPTIINRLRSMGIRMLVIEDELSAGISLDDLMDMPTWMDLVQGVQSCFKQTQLKKEIEPRPIFNMAGKLLDELTKNQILLPIPAATVAEELLPFAHAVNVTIWSLLIGRAMGYTALQLRDLAVGCLLHDFGKAVQTNYSQHPEAGFQLIKKHREINLMSAHVAFQHHELRDGSGFPRGIQGEAFLEMAQICGIANQYQEKLSEMNIAPHEIMELFMSLSDKSYSHSVIQAFVLTVPAYMPGVRVKMKDGQSAIVTTITTHMQRPIIRYEATQELLNLAEHHSVFIESVIETTQQI
ncbi:HD domain-containing protein [Paenibacillus sp. LjRoot153]|uniref:HD-GYP domain-containing protein n=1 Tax=Paenibacillus sp. LjRoot153 TaxID=3342270 RepID=UPI003ED0A917